MVSTSKKTALDTALQYFFAAALSVVIFAMCAAYKTPSQVWRGIHDTLVYKNSVVEILMGIIALCFIVSIILKKNFILQRDSLSIGLFVLVLFASASFFWSERPGYATQKTLMWACGLFAFFLTLQLSNNEKAVKFLINALFLATVLVAFIGLLQAFFNYRGVPQATPPASTFSNKNMANHPIILSFGVGLYLLFGAKERHFLIDLFYAACLSVLLAFVFHTKTRASWLAIAVELLIVLAFLQPIISQKYKVFHLYQLRRVATGLGILFLFFLMFIQYDPVNSKTVFKNPAASISSVAKNSAKQIAGANKGSFAVRKKIWSATAEVIKESPVVGVGMGNFYSAYPKHYLYGNESIRRAHNDYLEMIAEIGLLGFTIFMACMALMIFYCYKLFMSPKFLDKRFLLVCIVAMLGGTAVNASFSFPYYHITPMVLMGVYAGLIVGYYRLYVLPEAVSQDAIKNLSQHKSSAIVLLALLGIFAFISLRAAFYVENMESKWTKQLNSGSWTHIDLSEPRWLETTHYSPVLQGIYSALMMQKRSLDKRIETEKDFSKRLKIRNFAQNTEKMAEDIAINSNLYLPQLQFLQGLSRNYIAKKEYAKAVDVLERAKSLQGRGGVSVEATIARLISKIEGNISADKYITDVVKQYDPDLHAVNNMAYMSFGSTYYQLDNKAAAYDYFKKGFDTFPDKIAYLENMIRVLIAQHDVLNLAKNIEAYKRRSDANPKLVKAFNKELQKLKAL